MKHKGLTAYFIIVTLLSAAFIYAAKTMGKTANLVAALYMFVPAAAAFLTRVFFDEKRFSDAKLKFWAWQDYLKFWKSYDILVVANHIIDTNTYKMALLAAEIAALQK